MIYYKYIDTFRRFYWGCLQLMVDDFDPKNIREGDMLQLAEALSNFVEFFDECVIVPDEIQDKYDDDIKDGLDRVRKLIKKLKKGDRSVFKDEEEWNSLV